jgi:hypothetical protein
MDPSHPGIMAAVNRFGSFPFYTTKCLAGIFLSSGGPEKAFLVGIA